MYYTPDIGTVETHCEYYGSNSDTHVTRWLWKYLKDGIVNTFMCAGSEPIYKPEASEIQETFWFCDFFSKPALDEMINVSTCIVAGTKYDHLAHTCPLSLYLFDQGCKCFLYALTHSLRMVFQIQLVR